MRNMLRSVRRAIFAAWVKRHHNAERNKIEDETVSDLAAVLADMKREREGVERKRSETQRSGRQARQG
jgi:hypothetical protein